MGTPIRSALALLLLLSAAEAEAQGRWAVVVARAGENVPAARRAAEIAAVRLRAYGASVVDVDTARAVADNALGRPAQPVSPDVARRLATAADEVLEHVAFGRNDRALEAAEPVLERAESQLGAVGVDPEAHRHLGNLCLFTVRALLQDEREPEAQMRVLTCLRLVPDLAPDERMHPREVRRLLAAAREGLESRPHGILAVEGRRGCAVLLNGRAVGEAPLSMAVPPGTYDVQAVCDTEESARVRRVDIPRGGRAEVRVDAELGARLDATEGLLLAYADAASRSEHLDSDAAAVGRLFGVGNVLAVVPEADRTLRLARFRVQGREARVSATAQLPASPDVSADRVGEAVTALLEGGELAGRSGGGVASGGGGPSAVGWLLGGVGLAGVAAGWVLYGTWIDAQRQVDALDPDDAPTDFAEAVEARDERGTIVLVAGGAGLGILTASMPLILPEADGAPWWSFVLGAAGAGATAFGVVHSLEDGDELDDRNVPERTIPLGPLVAMHGAPLLAIPLVYAFRSAGSEVSPSVEASDEALRLSLRGRF